MSDIKLILNEEKERLQKLEKRYEEEISNLPSGTFSVKTRNGRKYAYRAYRLAGKVKTDYIGPVDNDKSRELEKLIARRKELEKLLKITRRKKNEILKVVK
jgi:hypothetical protein